MYQFSGKLKIFSLALIILGVVGIAFSFLSAPKTVEDAKAIIESHAAHGGHDSHGTSEHHSSENESHDSVTTHETHSKASAHGNHHDGNAHAAHVLHQLQNKPWSAFYVALFFFLGISLLVLAFYAAQRVAQSGWSIVLFRVFEAVSANIIPTSILMALIVVLSALHFNHLFPWMGEGIFDPTSENYDPIIDAKSWWMNLPGWVIRSMVYLALWNAYRFFIRKSSIAEDTADDNYKTYKKNYNASVIFLVVFMITETLMSWDWIMSIDPHWFSTLFGWYVFASMFVSGITTIALVTIYLKSKGYLEFVNDSHIHDLGKFMFGISVFWTYLWFSQFMLIWYSNIPEEVTYFITRIEDYNLPFFGMVVMNFVFPLLILMNSDYKRINYFIVMAGIVIILGHYMDVFNMIMPSAVGDQWFIGAAEIGGFLFFLGLFIFVVFKELTKAPLLAKGDPYMGESERFHY